MAIEIFLSYTWLKERYIPAAVQKFAQNLEEKLQLLEKDISIFYDKENIDLNANRDYFEPILESHLNNSKILLILLSEDWLQSYWCKREFSIYTNNSNRPIIPILWSEIDNKKFKNLPIDIQERVINVKRINFLNKSEAEYMAIVERITEYLIE